MPTPTPEVVATVDAAVATPDEAVPATPVDAAGTVEATPEMVASPVVVAVMDASPAASPEASPVASPEASPIASPMAAEVVVVSKDIFFEPNEVTIAADTDVTFVLPNEGAAPHNFTIDELDIDIDQDPGESYEVVINAPAGEYEFYCNVPGHREAGMIGTLIVE